MLGGCCGLQLGVRAPHLTPHHTEHLKPATPSASHSNLTPGACARACPRSRSGQQGASGRARVPHLLKHPQDRSGGVQQRAWRPCGALLPCTAPTAPHASNQEPVIAPPATCNHLPDPFEGARPKGPASCCDAGAVPAWLKEGWIG